MVAEPAPGSDFLLDGLSESQQAAVTSGASPLCVMAGAGSGKTRVLTRRIAYRIRTGEATPGFVLALTFTRKAAGELHHRLQSLGVRDRVAAGTFHGTAYAQLRRLWAEQDKAPPRLLERKGRVLARVAFGRPGQDRPAELGDLAAEIEWAKARMIPPHRYAEEAQGASRRPPLPPSAMAEVYGRYEEEKRRAGLVDFDDLLHLCAEAMEENPAFAAAQRWRFRHLFVDEFQDVNPAQYRLLSAWLGDRSDLCVVGDPNQAIYSWNGADPTLLLGFTRRFPQAEVVRLSDNYRSTPQVLAVAAAVLGQPPLRAHREDGPAPTVRSYPDEEAEARGIARMVRQARRPGQPWSEIAVLARTNAQLPVIERALRAVQVPSRLAGGAGLLDAAEVRQALTRLATVPPGQAFLSTVAELELEAEQPGDGPLDGSSREERRLQLLTFSELAREYAAVDQTPSASGLRAWLSTTLGPEHGPDGTDAVALSTFHRAKGLEWPIVFLAGLERGLVPIGRGEDPAAEAEERRLLYVALTRAQRHLHCTWAETRRFGARAVGRRPSPYLEAVELACDQIRGQAPAASGGSGAVHQLRARLAATKPVGRPSAQLAADADPAVLSALRRWRSNTAKASGVPAYVIFHDSTLAALARSCPSTPSQLLDLPGMGPVKISRYGEEILAVVAEHRDTA